MAGEGSLRPVRWRGLPRGGTLLRVGLVAVLLGLAAAVLSTPAGCPPPGAAPAGPSPASPGPGGSPRPDPGRSGAALPLPSGSVGVPVRLAEPAALAVLRPGARVDLLVVPAGGATGEASLLAPRALVLDVVGAGAVDGSSALYLALRPDQAQRAVGLPEGSRFAVVVRG
ncbi:flagellar biosynthesis protein FlgA [Micromonospora soli]|uniref:flagellar biosynthesis protein FlgA n=1 Tax=Micromonospora sp. NBRC 110009 TaxID=3061627 RepID=UPI002671300E|nr:flagellar biosynthesis protein FlgA [Micromonospora sp. NBRC 110009]WKU00337.1 flagellar biosynthesis protein FlgA [Micromonospora sp. NBRC 110009]